MAGGATLSVAARGAGAHPPWGRETVAPDPTGDTPPTQVLDLRPARGTNIPGAWALGLPVCGCTLSAFARFLGMFHLVRDGRILWVAGLRSIRLGVQAAIAALWSARELAPSWPWVTVTAVARAPDESAAAPPLFSNPSRRFIAAGGHRSTIR
jgi:hypothetical protein